ncbi:DUF1997 domain-containing protein [Vacuolonema iberomarrocanum]|uniref:DUF1997 domain-containing protein n=1 Tax=Vacuolonema iberomarrocanum TaxID=3454632 RepID=UPI003F6E367E
MTMNAQFHATQSIDLAVPELSIPVQHYLRQPRRLVNALMDSSRVEMLGQNEFRFKMRPLRFLSLSLQPIVDLRVEADAQGTIYLKSINCDVLGIDALKKHFHLDLEGYLSPVLVAGQTRLDGNADLQVSVNIPPMLWLTPKALVESTGNTLLKSILMTIKQRLTHQLLADYREWVSDQLSENERIAQTSTNTQQLAPKGSLS